VPNALQSFSEPSTPLLKKQKTCAMFLPSFSINLLAFYHECRLLIGYAAHFLFCSRSVVGSLKQCAVVIKMTANSLCFQSVCEEDLDEVLNDYSKLKNLLG